MSFTFCNSKYCFCPLTMNTCLRSKHKLNISLNLTCSTGALEPWSPALARLIKQSATLLFLLVSLNFWHFVDNETSLACKIIVIDK